MKSITVFESNDGSRWDTPVEATKRDRLIEAVNDATAALAPRPGSSFDGYVRQSPATVLAVKARLIHLANAEMGGAIGKNWPEALRDPARAHPHGVIGRVVSECDGPLSKAWFRLMCMDVEGREWEQPYYALNGSGDDYEAKAR